MNFGRECFRGASYPGKTRPIISQKSLPSKSGQKFAGNFPTFARPRSKIHPNSALQSLGLKIWVRGGWNFCGHIRFSVKILQTVSFHTHTHQFFRMDIEWLLSYRCICPDIGRFPMEPFLVTLQGPLVPISRY